MTANLTKVNKSEPNPQPRIYSGQNGQISGFTPIVRPAAALSKILKFGQALFFFSSVGFL